MNPFRRVLVDYDVRFTTLVTWELEPRFVDPLPYTAQLQLSRTGGTSADDWEDVGTPATNPAFLADDEQRLSGKTFTAHYRIRLTTSRGVYLSPPATNQTHIPFRDWRLTREMYRKERLRFRRYVGVESALLKERRYGPPCTNCTDTLTGSPTLSGCPVCFGTGYEGGYFAPIYDLWLDRNPEQAREQVDLQAEGTILPLVVAARVLGYPQIVSRDMIVERRSGRRWLVHEIQHQGELRGLPVVAQLELRLLPLSDVTYTLPVDFS